MSSDGGERSRVHIERAYEDPVSGRYRVLVDRLWPRGVTKERAALDHWAKDLAPSTELRRWYGHEPDRFDEFTRRYRRELEAGEAAEAVADLTERVTKGPVALVTATRDVDHSGARVLFEVLTGEGPPSGPG